MSVQSAYWALAGGIDLVTPALSVNPGSPILAQNYETNLAGGVSRIEGYELFDGSQNPIKLAGIGPVRGVWEFNGSTYAFRDNAAQTACLMYKSTSAGWEEVPLVDEGSMTYTLSSGGSYQFINHNFAGGTNTEAMFFCNGIDNAYMLSRSGVVTQINSGMESVASPLVPRYPVAIGIHKNHLFMAYSGGSLQHSSVGDPTDWSNGGEIGFGQDIHTLHSIQGNALMIAGDSRISVLYGSSSLDWDLQVLSPNYGLDANTVSQMETDTYFLDEEGISTLAATQTYGNFATANISAVVQPIFERHRATLVGSSINREKNQYRVFFGDRTVICGVFLNRELVGYTTWFIAHTPSCLSEHYMGCEDGSVMLLDSGPNFAGESISSFLRLPFNALGDPSRKKRFRKAVVTIKTGGEVTLNYLADFDYGAQGTSDATERVIQGGGSFWDVGEWGQFIWSAAHVSEVEAHLNGTGSNVSMLVVHESATDPSFTVQGVQLNYSVRGLNR